MTVETTVSINPLFGKSNVGLPPTLPTPKYVKEDLEYLQNYYIIHRDNSWKYYPIKMNENRHGNFYDILVGPPIIMEGYVCIDRKFIEVPIHDLMRGHVNVTRTVRELEEPSTKNTSSRKSKGTTNQSGSSELVGTEVSKAIDMVVEDQINSLLDLTISQEGGDWEIQDNS